MLAGAGTDVDDPVGDADRVFIVLDHDQSVAEIAQAYERLDQAVVVALVQADRRLVEDVEDADESGADLGGEPNALGLAAGQGAGVAVEGEVVEADVEQESQPLVDLLEHPLADLALPVRHLQALEVVGRLTDRQGTHFGDVLGSLAFAVELNRKDHGLEPGAGTRRARHLAHEALDPLLAGLGLGVCVAALEVGNRALE